MPNGNVTHYSYSSAGEMICVTTSKKDSIGFQDSFSDEATGNLLLGPRVYDPDIRSLHYGLGAGLLYKMLKNRDHITFRDGYQRYIGRTITSDFELGMRIVGGAGRKVEAGNAHSDDSRGYEGDGEGGWRIHDESVPSDVSSHRS